jgi:signal transduction histidine kinase/ActR/RegA family two-component response regulator
LRLECWKLARRAGIWGSLVNGLRNIGLTPVNVIVLLIALSFLLASGAAVLVSARHVEDSDGWVRHSLEVKSVGADFLTHMVDAETGQRGYLLTGKPEYLGPYDEAQKVVHTDLERLLALTADNPSQLKRMKELAALSDSKLSELKRTIDLVRQNKKPEALDFVISGVGKAHMDDIRRVVGEFKGEEDRLLATRFQAAATARHWTLGLVLVGLASAVFFAGVFVLSMVRLVKGLREATAALEIEAARRKEAEATLVHTQKIEAIGQLTGGIAHDFNNLLTVILGNLDTARRRIKAARPDAAQFASALQRPVEAAMEAGQSGAKLVRQLLTFARQQALAPEQLDLNRLMSGMSDMIQRTIGETVAVQTVLAGGLWPTFADAVQIESALLNLVVNARDAMPDGGRLTIETGNAYIDDDYASHFGDVAAGQYVLLSVTDTGSGIPADVLQHVFEPFFTTKGAGKGTGLGLAMVHGLVKQSKGHVRIYSEPGQGTTVKIYLPRMLAAGAVAAAPASLPSASEASAPRARDGEVVLLVEDNEGVRLYAVAILQDLGYRVLDAADMPAALKLLEEDAAEIDIVFTDVVLPLGLSGADLAEEVRRRRPGTPVLFTTGYTRNAIVHNGILDPDVHLINKPYTAFEVGKKLRQLLDRAFSSEVDTGSREENA